MWRALFLAVGIMAIIVGVESMLIESATVYSAGETKANEFLDPGATPARATKVLTPGEFFPWALLSTGAIIVLYAFTLPRRFLQAGGE